MLEDWQQRLRDGVKTQNALQQLHTLLQQHHCLSDGGHSSPGRSPEPSVQHSRQHSAHPESDAPPASQLITAVRKLLTDARDARAATAAMQGAAEDLARNPEGALQRVIKHFQDLFSVPSLDGCIPTMSRV